MQITLGAGLGRPQGRRVEVEGVEGLAQALREAPAAVEAWWSPHVFRADYRDSDGWEATWCIGIDIDQEGHAAIPGPVAQQLDEASKGGGICGSLYHRTPAGARIVFVLDAECRDPDDFDRAARGASRAVADDLRELGIVGLTVDPKPHRDLARLFFTPNSIAKGVRRHADVLVLRAEPYSLSGLHSLAPDPQRPTLRPVPNTPATPPNSDPARRARGYVMRMGPSVEGARGDDHGFKVAATLVNDFGLSDGEAWDILVEWNGTCLPPWAENELRRFLRSARKNGTHPVGSKLLEDRPQQQIHRQAPLPPQRAAPENPQSAIPAEKPQPAALTLTLDDIQYPPKEKYVIGSLIPMGKSSVVFGPTSVGKSALMSQLVFAVAAGADALWGLPLMPGGCPVLVYSAEDTIDDWKRKGGAVLNGYRDEFDWAKALSRFHVIDHSDGLARLSEVVTVRTGFGTESVSQRVARPTSAQDHLIQAAKQVGAGLILVETASRLVEDEDNANFSALQSALGRIGRETGAAVIVSHHATKAASKENDAGIESARGGGALIFNARSALSLFPADPETVKGFDGRFPAEDIVTLYHGKSTSSSRRSKPITLIRCDAVHGAVFRLPDEVEYTPEQAEKVQARLDAAKSERLEAIRRLYDVVEALLPIRPNVSPSYLRDQKHRDIKVPKHRVDQLVQDALDCGALRVKTRSDRGITLALGANPSNPIGRAN